MHPLRKFLQLRGRDRRLVAGAFLIVLLVRAGLWLLPFARLQRLVARFTRRSGGPEAAAAGMPPERIAWAVSAVACRIPRATCLTQALAGTLLLARYGHGSTLHLGVAKRDDRRLHAHAWLESEGRIVLGEPREGAFVSLPSLSFPR